MSLRGEIAEDGAAEDEDEGEDEEEDDEDEEGRFLWFRTEVSLPPASQRRRLQTSLAPVTLTGECSVVQAQKKTQAAAAWRQRAK